MDGEREGIPPDLTFKIVLVGDPGVGKTSLLRRWTKELTGVLKERNDHGKPIFPTDYFQFGTRVYHDKDDETTVKAQLLERGKSLHSMDIPNRRQEQMLKENTPPELFLEHLRDPLEAFYHDAAAAVIIFDLRSWESLCSVKYWLEEVRQYTVPPILIMLIGNKWELELQPLRQWMSYLTMHFCIENKFDYSEISTSFTTNVENTLDHLLKEIRRMKCRNSTGDGSVVPLPHIFPDGDMSRGTKPISPKPEDETAPVTGDLVYRNRKELRQSKLTPIPENKTSPELEGCNLQRHGESKREFTFKIVLVGDPLVGKSSILRCGAGERLASDSCRLKPTKSFEFHSCTIQMDGRTINIQILERDNSLLHLFSLDNGRAVDAFYLKAAEAVIIFDLGSWKKFCTVKKWLDEVRMCTTPSMTTISISNKLDKALQPLHQFIVELTACDNTLDYHQTSTGKETIMLETFAALLNMICSRNITGSCSSARPSLPLASSPAAGDAELTRRSPAPSSEPEFRALFASFYSLLLLLSVLLVVMICSFT